MWEAVSNILKQPSNEFKMSRNNLKAVMRYASTVLICLGIVAGVAMFLGLLWLALWVGYDLGMTM